MHPILFESGPIKIHTFGVMLVLAFIAGMQLAKARAPKFGFSPTKVSDMLFWTLIAGVIGARIGYIVQEVPYYLANPDKFWTLQFQGLTSFGGIILGAVAVIVFAKRQGWPIPSTLDLIAPAFILGHIIGRIGCLLNGCCYGVACDLPWAVSVAGLEGRYHPAQAYDALMNLAILGIILKTESRVKFRPGQVLGYTLVLHAITRMIYEIWRAGASAKVIGGTPFTEAQLAALIVAIVGAICFVTLPRVSRAEPTA